MFFALIPSFLIDTRVVGVLLGKTDKDGVVDVVNSFAGLFSSESHNFFFFFLLLFSILLFFELFSLLVISFLISFKIHI